VLVLVDWRHYPSSVSMSILEQVQADTRQAMKAGERDRVVALRMLTNALQQDAKLGDADEVAALQRERKRRLEAARAYRDGGREDRAAAEEAEATIIDQYLPEQLSDRELEEAVAAAIEESAAAGPADIGRVMSLVMPRLKGRVDGKRVSDAVRAGLSGG
jgi:uncharacterized protein